MCSFGRDEFQKQYTRGRTYKEHYNFFITFGSTYIEDRVERVRLRRVFIPVGEIDRPVDSVVETASKQPRRRKLSAKPL
jgi:hypothetical protein